MAGSAPDNVVFIKIDPDDSPDLARQWAVQGLPTMIRIQNGHETGRMSGYKSEAQIREFAAPESRDVTDYQPRE